MTAVRVCSVDDLAPGQARRVEVDGRPVALVRIGDDFYALGDICTHQKISLSEGEVHADTLEIECWKHGSCFSLTTGAHSALPATRPEPVFAVTVEGSDVLVEAPVEVES